MTRLQISGTVSSVDERHYGDGPKSTLLGTFIRLSFGTIALVVSAIAYSIVQMFSNLFSGEDRSSHFSSSFLAHTSAIVVGDKLIDRQGTVLTRDYRIVLGNGEEALVRSYGEAIRGAIAIGDKIELDVSGRSQPFVIRGGYNHNLQTEISFSR